MVAKRPVSPGGGPARPRRTAFARGFRQRNPLVLVVAVLLAGLFILLAQQVFLRGGFTAVSEGRFLRIENDDYVHLAYTLAQLKKDPPVGPTLYLFGGSGAMESIVSQRSLAQQLARSVHVVVRPHDIFVGHVHRTATRHEVENAAVIALSLIHI